MINFMLLPASWSPQSDFSPHPPNHRHTLSKDPCHSIPVIMHINHETCKGTSARYKSSCSSPGPSFQNPGDSHFPPTVHGFRRWSTRDGRRCFIHQNQHSNPPKRAEILTRSTSSWQLGRFQQVVESSLLLSGFGFMRRTLSRLSRLRAPVKVFSFAPKTSREEVLR
jgi:hypothetical protein